MFPYVSLTFSMAIGLKVAVYDNDRELVCKQTVPKLFALRHLQCHAFFQEILIREFLSFAPGTQNNVTSKKDLIWKAIAERQNTLQEPTYQVYDASLRQGYTVKFFFQSISWNTVLG